MGCDRLIVFRLDADQNIGFGHFRRCLILSSYFKRQGYRCLLLVCGKIPSLLSGAHRQDVRLVSNNLDSFDEIKPDLVFLDLLESRYFDDQIRSLKRGSRRFPIVTLDGFYDALLEPDLSIIPWANRDEGVNLKYFAVPFDWLRERSKKFCVSRVAGRLLICIGGGDPYHASLKVLKLVTKLFNFEEVVVIAGPYYSASYLGELSDFCRAIPGCNLIVNPSCISKYLAQADIAIISGGQIKFEAAFFRLPSLVLSNNSAERDLTVSFQKFGSCIYISGADNFDRYKLFLALKNLKRSRMLRAKMRHMGSRLIDGGGGYRIVKDVSKKIFGIS